MSLVSNNVFRLIFKDTILDYDSINNILKILRETEQKIWIDENGCMKWIPITISDKSFKRWKNEIVHRGELCEYYVELLEKEDMEDIEIDYNLSQNNKICLARGEVVPGTIHFYESSSRWCGENCQCDYINMERIMRAIDKGLTDAKTLYDERIRTSLTTSKFLG